jgi:Iodothyronine deiodinase
MFQIRLSVSFAFVLFFAGQTAFSLDNDAFPAPIRKLLNERFTLTGPRPGDFAPDFKLHKPDGGLVRASELWARKPVLLMTGSLSCPIFRASTDPRRALREKYGGRVEFVVVYVIEAHPSDRPNPYTPPGGKGFLGLANKADGIEVRAAATYEERLANARKCQAALGIKSIIAVDTLDNPVWEAYGSSPNCAYLIAKGGKVIVQQGLFHAEDMEPAIKKLLGEK